MIKNKKEKVYIQSENRICDVIDEKDGKIEVSIDCKPIKYKKGHPNIVGAENEFDLNDIELAEVMKQKCKSNNKPKTRT